LRANRWLSGICLPQEQVTVHNQENGFCVLRAKARGHRDLVAVVGQAASISVGAGTTTTPMPTMARSTTAMLYPGL
jgi:hypothetical protein